MRAGRRFCFRALSGRFQALPGFSVLPDVLTCFWGLTGASGGILRLPERFRLVSPPGGQSWTNYEITLFRKIIRI